MDAIHILCSDSISTNDLQNAETLLSSFVTEFEELYGKINMVSNIHQLKHLSKCVKENGPLFCYSNYVMEDFIGHLVSFVSGKTDVLEQISDRYILEKKLLECIQSSPLVEEFYNQIRSEKPFANAEKIQNTIVIGRSKFILTQEEKEFIKHTLLIEDGDLVDEYKAAFVNKRHFYQKDNNTRTNDSLVFDVENNSFCELKCVFTLESCVYFLVSQKYKINNRWKDICCSIIPLEILENCNLKIINVMKM